MKQAHKFLMNIIRRNAETKVKGFFPRAKMSSLTFTSTRTENAVKTRKPENKSSDPHDAQECPGKVTKSED